MTELNTHSKFVIANVSRRGLLKGVAATGGLVLAAQLPAVRGALAAYPTGATGMPDGVVSDPQVFVSIGADGIVSIVAHAPRWATARTHGPAHGRRRRDGSRLGARARRPVAGRREEIRQPGHRRLAQHAPLHPADAPVRRRGAQMLEQAAAKKWGVPEGEVQAQMHEVVHKPSGRKLGYGELAADAAALPVPADDKIKLKDPSAFRYIGKGNVRITDMFDITTGKAIYGQDIVLPGMKFAVVARPPVVGGKVASFDSSAAMKVPGVEKIVQLAPTPAPAKFAPLGGVAVIANNTWAAMKGREALKVTWDDGPNKVYDSEAYKAQLEESVKKPGKVERNEGDVDKALACAAKVIAAEYYIPHIAHATMEPPAATARMSDGKWEVWAPCRAPAARATTSPRPWASSPRR